ncbi:hypothetical protein HYH02_014532 [Chlamydomonas schloesseri]|uniref:Thioredoxin domain-containing protein n=1 Tax=Chlamydomonas schloesseri TaxID=2026947 RepID=A0A835SWA0_9CHLO|nr:hypothetical protein HYH02_014532 [Chlamydomonas schloesseri]|eukprot:KAG2427700.1 hypothetical protein HYH02_014532 [Chlamydomonas schloesseri]
MRLAFRSPAPVQGSAHPSRPSSTAFPGPRLAAASPVAHPAPAPSCSSSGDTCSLGGGSSFAGHTLASGPAAKQRLASPPAAAPEAGVKTAVDKHWWNSDKELWIEAHSEEDFQREISTGSKLVAVDFFATWCHGCEKSYPEICRTIKDPELQKKFKFVKVCVDELKSVAKTEGITGLPRMAVYQPGAGQLALLDVPFSKVKFLKTNLNVISGNPGMAFGVDPNGFVVPKGRLPSQGEAAAAAEKKKREVEALTSGTGGLFERLMKVAGGGGAAAKDKDNKAAAAAEPHPSTNGAHASTLSSSAGHGASASAAAPAKAPAELVKPAGSCRAPPGVDAAAYEAARRAFLAAHGSEYGYGGVIDELYPKEVGCRMQPNEHYMDYTGSSVYCQTQLGNVFAELRQCMFGNPHSANPSSSFTSERVEEVRDMVLRFFNASPAEYQVVFTKSATDGLKLVGETFPWSEGSMFRYLRENHNSVLGVREYALQGGGAFQAVNETFVDRWAVRGDASCDHVPPASRLPAPTTYSLFTFPAEDNFAGVKYPLEWVRAVQARSTDSHRWLVMVDAAAYVPTQPLDLSQTPVDFVDLSFYKMFGFPTGVGALIVKTSVVPLMRKVFWGGGTVALATSEDNFHVLKCKPSDRLEDGTVAFLDVIAVKHGIAMMNSLGGIRRVQAHVACLTEWLYTRLATMRHSNGSPMLAIFGKHHLPNHRQVQGAILNFELLRPDGSIFSYKTFEREAATAGFHVRTGAECNPGACYNYLGVKEAEVESLAGKKEGCEDDVEFIKVQRPVTASQEDCVTSSDLLRSIANSNLSLNHPAAVALKWVEVPLGSVRVSLGWWSTFDDVYALGDWIERTYRDRTE